MTELPLILYTALAAVATAGLFAAYAVRLFCRRRARGRDATLRALYLKIVMYALMSDDEQDVPPRIPLIGLPGARKLLAETIAGVAATTYGLDMRPLRRIIAGTDTDGWLLRRIRWSRGYRRAHYLSLLSLLPVDAVVSAHAARYAGSKNRYVRFYALLVQLAADSSAALRLMAEHPSPFSACEVAEIMALLRRGMLPVAYEPLVGSPSGNLRRVGLGIVRQFGIEEAEARLLRIVAESGEAELWREALYTLCSLRRPLTHRGVVARVESMSPEERKALLRRMALEGYSPDAMRRLFGTAERPYYESIVQSYKRCLV